MLPLLAGHDLTNADLARRDDVITAVSLIDFETNFNMIMTRMYEKVDNKPHGTMFPTNVIYKFTDLKVNDDMRNKYTRKTIDDILQQIYHWLDDQLLIRDMLVKHYRAKIIQQKLIDNTQVYGTLLSPTTLTDDELNDDPKFADIQKEVDAEFFNYSDYIKKISFDDFAAANYINNPTYQHIPNQLLTYIEPHIYEAMSVDVMAALPPILNRNSYALCLHTYLEYQRSQDQSFMKLLKLLTYPSILDQSIIYKLNKYVIDKLINHEIEFDKYGYIYTHFDTAILSNPVRHQVYHSKWYNGSIHINNAPGGITLQTMKTLYAAYIDHIECNVLYFDLNVDKSNNARFPNWLERININAPANHNVVCNTSLTASCKVDMHKRYINASILLHVPEDADLSTFITNYFAYKCKYMVSFSIPYTTTRIAHMHDANGQTVAACRALQWNNVVPLVTLIAFMHYNKLINEYFPQACPIYFGNCVSVIMHDIVNGVPFKANAVQFFNNLYEIKEKIAGDFNYINANFKGGTMDDLYDTAVGFGHHAMNIWYGMRMIKIIAGVVIGILIVVVIVVAMKYESKNSDVVNDVYDANVVPLQEDNNGSTASTPSDSVNSDTSSPNVISNVYSFSTDGTNVEGLNDDDFKPLTGINGVGAVEEVEALTGIDKLFDENDMQGMDKLFDENNMPDKVDPLDNMFDENTVDNDPVEIKDADNPPTASDIAEQFIMSKHRNDIQNVIYNDKVIGRVFK